ncbi:MAG: hypothetical protein ACYDEI_08955, partial [Erysipelotrichaceae bacterium]
MVKKKKRKLKVRNIILMFVFLSIVVISTILLKDYLNPYKEDNFIKIGYQTEEIEFILSLDDQEKDKILTQNRIENIIKHYTIENYTELNTIGYSDSEIDQILKLDLSIQDYLLNHEYLSEIFEWIEIDNFMFKNIDRYLIYQTKYPDVKLVNIFERVNTNRDYAYYTNVQSSDTSLDDLLLVNKYYALDENYSPSNMISISPYGSVKMVRTAALAFIEL